MFNQKQKSIRGKADSAPTANANTNTNATATTNASVSSPKSGLLSFNTSNFTKLFKNSTNFVQSTFGSGSTTAQAQTQSALQSQATSHNSSAEITEQSFTIPSIKKRHDASNPCAPKKQRDILSTPVLIQPSSVSMTSTSPLANLSSYKKIPNDDYNNAAPKAYSMSNGSQKAHKQPAQPDASVTVTTVPVISASNQKPSSLSHARNSISSSSTSTASPTKQIDIVEKPSTDAKLQSPQRMPGDQNAMPTLSIVRSPAAKPNNANILFETVKMSKQNAATSTPSNTASSAASTTQSCSIPSNALPQQYTQKNSSISSGNHIKSTITKNDMNKNISNEQQSANENTTAAAVVAASIQNAVDNELMDGRHLDGNREIANATLSSNRSKATAMNVAPVISSASKHFSTSIVPESTKSTIVPSTNSVASKQKYYKQINDNGLVSCDGDGVQAKNNNLLEIDVLNKDDVDISANIVCNNNLEYSVDDYMRQMNNTNDNPFKLSANKFSAADLMAQIAENSKTVENIYANCVMMPMKSANLDNYQQQDTNENVIATNEIDALVAHDATDGPNNNYSSNEHFMHTDSSSNVCNNNDLNEIDQLDISNGDDGVTTTAISTHTITNSSDSPSKSSQNILSNFNANCFAPKSNELYDILEESDDEERTNLFRFNRWNSSCSLFVPKSTNANVNPISSSSFAAAIAFANEMNSTNHNPFLQLIAVSPTTNIEASTASDESPDVINSSQAQLFYERQKNPIGIAAPLNSSAFNNNDQSDGVCMAFTSMDKCLTSSTSSVSNCASGWNDLAAMQAPFEMSTSHSSSQINGFIEQNDFQLNATPNSTATPKNHISSTVMDTMLLFLKEHGNQYIKQFMQVI